jgi:uncharacterized membrane protein
VTRPRRPPLRYWPHPPIFLVGLVLLGALVLGFALIQVGTTAFALAGVSPSVAGLVLLASLLGSALNVPVAVLKTNRQRIEYRRMRVYGVVYAVPVAVPGRTVLAVNVGGAVVPVAVSLYLTVHSGLWVPALVATTLVAVVVHLLARPVRGVGIVVPMLVPALVATAAALLLHPVHAAGAVAYIGGTIGALVGADLTHLRWIRGTGAPIASIGGAGTFDGVFLTGILAVLLATLL